MTFSLYRGRLFTDTLILLAALDTETQGQCLMLAAAEPNPDSKRWPRMTRDTAVSGYVLPLVTLLPPPHRLVFHFIRLMHMSLVYLPRAHLTLNTILASATCGPRPPHAHPMQPFCPEPILRAWMPHRRPTTGRCGDVRKGRRAPDLQCRGLRGGGDVEGAGNVADIGRSPRSGRQ
jgi:hypothetical protein